MSRTGTRLFLAVMLLWWLSLSADTFIVTNTSDFGAGSLRDALSLTYTTPSADSICFKIPTSDPGYDAANGVWVIKPTGTVIVPVKVTIDGRLPLAGGGFRPGIEIDGTNLYKQGVSGISTNENNILRGLIITNWQYGIWLSKSNVVIQTCYIGTDATGKTAKPNNGDGILIANGVSKVLILGNLLSGNRGSGLRMFGASTSGIIIRQNRIGTQADGLAELHNGYDGIMIQAGVHDCIIEQNVISGNNMNGIDIYGAGANHNIIRKNNIGTDLTGTKAIPNKSSGVLVFNGACRDSIGPANIIAFNGGDGVTVDGNDTLKSTIGHRITANSIFANTGLGINTVRTGNGELAAPLITTLSKTQVTGTAKAGQIVEVFADRAGQGENYLGSTIANGSGKFAFNFQVPPTLPSITVTATDADGNTSPFSSPISTEVEQADQIPEQFDLSQNYPNPFNPATVISYQLPSAAHVDLAIYSVNGQKIMALVSGWRPAGTHQAIWNGCDENGKSLASGIYFYRLQAGDFVAIKKMSRVR